MNNKYEEFSLNDENHILYTVDSFLEEQGKINNNTILYFCANYTYYEPINDVKALDKYLKNK